MSPTLLIPIPSRDFDPSETGIPWQVLSEKGFRITFTTPDGMPGTCDPRMLTGKGLGPLAPLLAAPRDARAAYQAMEQSPAFQHPIPWREARVADFDGLILPGGHAPGMKEYLESETLQALVASFLEGGKPVGAICHGVVLAARSRRADGKSLLYGRKTTALLKSQELTAWALTVAWLGSYYRTYPTPVEDEVRSVLADPADFQKGPLPMRRDSAEDLSPGFAVCDGRYVSARWPGDAHTFSMRFAELF